MIFLNKKQVQKFFDDNGLDVCSVESSNCTTETIDGEQYISDYDAYKELGVMQTLLNDLIDYVSDKKTEEEWISSFGEEEENFIESWSKRTDVKNAHR